MNKNKEEKSVRFNTLEAWVAYIGSLHHKTMDLGLERVKEVASRLELLQPKCQVITVGGTNGKGSCVAGLEAIYRAAGYRVGAFTSPYLFRLNEEVRIQGVDVDDVALCRAFERIELARENISLTPFEFNTLAALEIFRSADLDVCLFEVGLGGRLDAVNVVDAAVAVVASIGIDHVEWLGNTRELIGKEKAGIFRAGRQAVCGDVMPPETLLNCATTLGTRLYCQQRDFYYQENGTSWSWQSHHKKYEGLPTPSLALQNMSTVLMTVELLQDKLPVTRQSIDQALQSVSLPGRIQIFSGEVTQVIDVSHNPAAAEFLVKKLTKLPFQGKTRAVFSMLADKDIPSTLHVMKSVVDDWYIAELDSERRASQQALLAAFSQVDIERVQPYADIKQAYQAAMHDSLPGDRVVVFGSFFTVAGIGLSLGR